MSGIIPPGSTIGILGGGQLGRMTAMAAARLGYRCQIMAPEADSPAAEVAAGFTCAAYEDKAALDRFAAAVDVVTLEFENVPVGALEHLAARVPVRPSAAVLAVTQDRLLEKRRLRELDIPVAGFWAIDDAAGLGTALDEAGGQGVLKTRRLGYDGKGQAMLGPDSDPGASLAALGGRGLVLERFVDFAFEASVIAARGASGEVRCFEPVLNEHENHILRRTIVPAPIDAATASEATRLAARIAAELEVVGLIAVEMFVTREGRLLVNELAPRPHNSGHWTIDACAVSQFEQLVRAICGLPLGATERIAEAVMENLLGFEAERWRELLAEPGLRLHLYGKREARPGRKMGHLTRLIAAGAGARVRR
jgi:5-(carboxyamino)imidazole ribonucleotide synthase